MCVKFFKSSFLDNILDISIVLFWFLVCGIFILIFIKTFSLLTCLFHGLNILLRCLKSFLHWLLKIKGIIEGWCVVTEYVYFGSIHSVFFYFFLFSTCLPLAFCSVLFSFCFSTILIMPLLTFLINLSRPL